MKIAWKCGDENVVFALKILIPQDIVSVYALLIITYDVFIWLS